MPTRRKFVIWGIGLQVLGLLVLLTDSDTEPVGVSAGQVVSWLLFAAGLWILLAGVIAVGVRMGLKDASEPEKPSNERLTLRR